MQPSVRPLFIPYRIEWTWAVALIAGLLISSVITGLSVGLPLGLACCSYGSTYTEYDGYEGDVIGSDLYLITKASANNIIDECKAVCNLDPACAYFEYNYSLAPVAYYCRLYTASQVSAIAIQLTPGSNVYLKSGYSLPNNG